MSTGCTRAGSKATRKRRAVGDSFVGIGRVTCKILPSVDNH